MIKILIMLSVTLSKEKKKVVLVTQNVYSWAFSYLSFNSKYLATNIVGYRVF